MCQQSFPQPKLHNIREANQAIRRAKQHKDLKIKFSSIPAQDLMICCHSDAAFANVGTHTQAGYIVGFAEKKLHQKKSQTGLLWCGKVTRCFVQLAQH
jgi:hypothetical protein